MNVVVRVDSSYEIGTGHIMRCLTLAKQLRENNVQITFVCRNFLGNNIELIENEGFKVLKLYANPKNNNTIQWTRENWSQDAKETEQIIRSYNIEMDLLIVDHYGIDEKWEKQLHLSVDYIMVIDDMANRPHKCDVLLDQNYYLNMNERYKDLVPKNCIQLLGPDYLLLREEFLEIDNEKIKHDGNIRNILIFFGGTDPTGETLKALEVIKVIKPPEVIVNVIVGSKNPLKEEIKEICSTMEKTIFHCQTKSMAKLMRLADLAIGSGGTTTWERCYLKLPSITVVIAENQYEVAEAVAVKGATINLGKVENIDKEMMTREIINLFSNRSKVIEVSQKCGELVSSSVIKERLVSKKIMELCE